MVIILKYHLNAAYLASHVMSPDVMCCHVGSDLHSEAVAFCLLRSLNSNDVDRKRHVKIYEPVRGVDHKLLELLNT